MEISKLEGIASQVRRDIVRMVSAVNSGHPGGSLGCTDFLTFLYFEAMNHSATPFSMDGKNEDLFFLSNGHRMASGSLGQGLSNALGAAQTKKLNNDPSTIFTLHGDGELQEGQIWEAAMYAAANKVDNIIATIDFNGRQIDGDVENVLSLGNLEEKWEAFGWEVLSMNGHDFENIREIMTLAKSKLGKGKPIVIIMKTEMGQGVDFMVGSHKWHGIAPNAEQLEDALKQLEETLGDY